MPMDVLTRLAVMIGLLTVGVGLRRVGVLDATRVEWLNSVAFYVVLPALVFNSTYDKPLAEIITPTLLVGLVVVLGITAGVGWLVHRRITDDGARAAATVQSYHTNLGYIGLPVVASALGERAAGIGSVILGMGALVQIPLTVSILVAVTGNSRNFRSEVRRLATNPVLVALVIGLAVSRSPATVTGIPADVIALVAEAALPVALLCVGGSIQLQSMEADRSIVGSVLAMKLLVMPVVAWVVYAALGADLWTLRTAVVMFGAPAAVSTFVYVTEMGGDRRLASILVFLSTVASAFTLSAWIAIVP
ncbi:Putative permease [Halorhabdus sp. SVX81]|nr:Putative permease [Halorhabdus sp. SVX81]